MAVSVTFGSIATLVTTDQGERYGISLDASPQPFLFYHLDRTNGRGVGMLYSNVRIELDTETAVNADRFEELGDMVLTPEGMTIVAKAATSGWANPMRFPLWGVPASESMEAVAFKRWRLVVGEIDKPIVLWERVPAA